MTCVTEKLKFTPTPQPSQCLELDNEITIQCSAKGREVPTIRWTKAGERMVGSHHFKKDKDQLLLKELSHPKSSIVINHRLTNAAET